jgi:hypothetical protein
MDDERPFTAAERSFFSECGTGSGQHNFYGSKILTEIVFFVVPVVAIFTKFDALEVKAYSEIKDEPETTRKEAIARAPARAVADFQKNYLPDLYARKYPPRRHVYLRSNICVLSLQQ